MANTERLLALKTRLIKVDELQNQPEYRGDLWEQETWRNTLAGGLSEDFCQTSMCSAGWTVVIDLTETGEKGPWFAPYDHLLPARPDEVDTGAAWRERDGYVVDIKTRAQRLLELTNAQASLLFYRTDTDITEMSAAIDHVIAGTFPDGFDYYEDDYDD